MKKRDWKRRAKAAETREERALELAANAQARSAAEESTREAVEVARCSVLTGHAHLRNQLTDGFRRETNRILAFLDPDSAADRKLADDNDVDDAEARFVQMKARADALEALTLEVAQPGFVATKAWTDRLRKARMLAVPR